MQNFFATCDHRVFISFCFGLFELTLARCFGAGPDRIFIRKSETTFGAKNITVCSSLLGAVATGAKPTHNLF